MSSIWSRIINLAGNVTGVLPTANGGTAQNSTATFPTSGVVVTEAATEELTSKTIGTATSIGGSTFAGPLIVGKTNGSSTSAGYIGEEKLISRLATNGLSLTNNAPANIGTTTSVTLTPGFWMLTGAVSFKATAATSNISEYVISVSNTTAALTAAGTIGVPSSTGEFRVQVDFAAQIPGASAFYTIPFSYTLNVAASTVLFLVGDVSFTGVAATVEGSGYLKATRIS